MPTRESAAYIYIYIYIKVFISIHLSISIYSYLSFCLSQSIHVNLKNRLDLSLFLSICLANQKFREFDLAKTEFLLLSILLCFFDIVLYLLFVSEFTKATAYKRVEIKIRTPSILCLIS